MGLSIIKDGKKGEKKTGRGDKQQDTYEKIHCYIKFKWTNTEMQTDVRLDLKITICCF